jgi:hypothetical protein
MKVLYMSGYTDHILARHGLESGIHLLEKPFTRDKLLGKVREVLQEFARGPSKRGSQSRRSQRMSIQVRIRVERDAKGDSPLCEETRTLTVNMHGALITLQAKPQVHEILRVQNTSTHETQEAKVVFVCGAKDGTSNVGLEFTKPNPSFWHVTFPPEDWTPNHPDAKANQDWEWEESMDTNQVDNLS